MSARRMPSIRRSWIVGPLTLFVAIMVAPFGRGEAAPVPGSQGTNTALPATESAVTVNGRDKFADLEISVNQTKELTNQAVSITWRGGTKTRSGPGDFAGHFLQIFQCWGDDDGTNLANPGPPPEQCQQGAVGGQPGGVGGSSYPNGLSMSRVIGRKSFPNYDPDVGVLETRVNNGNVWLPFRAVDGTVVNFPTDPLFNPSVQGGNFWLNPYYNIVTTNEIPGARTGSNGTGSELFQVQTGLEAPGLGCGQKVQSNGDGSLTRPRCWIVIVPRGAPADENAGMGEFETLADQFGVYSSPLSPSVWKNRIAIPLDFKPVESPCELSGIERRIAGSELVMQAVTSWQPILCGELGLPPFSYASIGDAAARQQLAASVAGGPSMVLVSRPLTSVQESQTNPTVYAPLTISGIVFAFNIERQARVGAPSEQIDLNGVRIGELNLTPRLVAKLLTQSYQSQVYVGTADPGYPWDDANPFAMGTDPDFLRFNPEFELMTYVNRLLGGLSFPSGASDVALQVWEWILADPEAKAWLDGEPDEWGMKVNPVYATTAEANTSGSPFGVPTPQSFPKADPFCFQAPVVNQILPSPLCGTDWMPYTRSLRESAQNTLAGNDTAKIASNAFAQSASDYWKRDPPQPSGSRIMLTVTDTVSAQRYGLRIAGLSRSGDGGSDRQFIVPDTTSMTAEVAGMTRSDSGVLIPNPTGGPSSGYPLTAMTWGAVKPLALDAQTRADLADFVSFTTGDGQRSGSSFGELPAGYAPLPSFLATTAAEAVAKIETMQAAAATTTTTTTVAEPAATTTVASTSVTTAVESASPVPATTAGQVVTSRTNSSSTTGSSSSSTRPTTATVVSGVTEDASAASSAVPDTSSVPVAEETPPTTTVVQPTAVSTTDAPIALTPGLDTSKSRFVVALVCALALFSGLIVLEITKRARRAVAESSEPLEPLDVELPSTELPLSNSTGDLHAEPFIRTPHKETAGV